MADYKPLTEERFKELKKLIREEIKKTIKEENGEADK